MLILLIINFIQQGIFIIVILFTIIINVLVIL